MVKKPSDTVRSRGSDTPSEPPRIFSPSPGFAHGSWHELSGSCFAGPVLLTSLQALDRQQGELAARYPAGIGTVNIIRLNSASGHIGDNERAYSEGMVRKFGSRMRANATIIFGNGFVAAAARSIMVAQRFVSRARYPDATFSTLAAANTWIAKELHYSEEEGAAALAFFLALFDACSPINAPK